MVLSLKTFFNERTERQRELIQGLCVVRIQTQSLEEYGLSLFLLVSRFVFVVFSETKQAVAIISYDVFVVYCAHSFSFSF